MHWANVLFTYFFTLSHYVKRRTPFPLVFILYFTLNFTGIHVKFKQMYFSHVQSNPAISKSQGKWKKVRNSGAPK